MTKNGDNEADKSEESEIDFRIGADKAPKPYRADRETEFRQKVHETLGRLEWAYVGTMSHGWPATHACRFVHEMAEDLRPVLYLICDRSSGMADEIERQPRIGIEAHLAVSWLERRKARAVQLQGLAAAVTDDSENSQVAAIFAQKHRNLRNAWSADDAQIFRAEILSVVNFYATGRPQWGYIDYTRNS